MARKKRIDAGEELTVQRGPEKSSRQLVSAVTLALADEASGTTSPPAKSGAGEIKSGAMEESPLSLTQGQREALMGASDLEAATKRKLEAGQGTQVVLLMPKELIQIDQHCNFAAAFAPPPHKRQLAAVQKKVADLLEAVAERHQSRVRRRSAAASDLLFQFKITLLDTEPAIWRRIEVEDCDLADLHDHIQAAFGWEDYHMHQFEIAGERYGPMPDEGFGLPYDPELNMLDETGVMLGDLLPKSRKRPRWIYEYDFGDGWRHEIAFEGYPEREKGKKYPLCAEGARACPPEDCGGPWGYADLLEALADPQHERHEEFMEWCGSLDPEAFDPAKATRQMRKRR
jgi:hypothetical protein